MLVLENSTVACRLREGLNEVGWVGWAGRAVDGGWGCSGAVWGGAGVLVIVEDGDGGGGQVADVKDGSTARVWSSTAGAGAGAEGY